MKIIIKTIIGHCYGKRQRIFTKRYHIWKSSSKLLLGPVTCCSSHQPYDNGLMNDDNQWISFQRKNKKQKTTKKG